MTFISTAPLGAKTSPDRKTTDFDCRAGVVEICQSADPVPLNSDTLEAIIVPDRLLVHNVMRVSSTTALLRYRSHLDLQFQRSG